MKVYLDNSATTQLDALVLSDMLPYFTNHYGNASSLHSFGRDAAQAVDTARETIAKSINAKSSEIYFTSGGTESDNWALKGVVMASKSQKKHIITSAIEHPAMLETLDYLKKEMGIIVTYIPVNLDGFVSVEDIKNAITDDTLLVSIMTANNEIGTIQPIAEIGALCRQEGILFHTDAVQAMDSQIIDVVAENIDMLSISAHKFHGPKGIGILYLRSGVRIEKLIIGGHQERRQRAGTTNTPLIVGMASALALACKHRAANNTKTMLLRDYFIKEAFARIPYIHLNGSHSNRLPNNINLSFDFIEGESLLMVLDLAGIAVSSGSACSAGSLEPSHVILALGVPQEQAHSSIRFSLGRDTTKAELDYTLKTLTDAVKKLRSWSPLYNETKGEGQNV